MARMPWRFTCPKGHHSWCVNSKSVPERKYRCEVCVKHGYDSAFFATLTDKRDTPDGGETHA